MKISSAVIFATLIFPLSGPLIRAQDAVPPNSPAKLADLLAEAERNNPQIEAARREWDASKQVPSQASTRPDPEFVLQHLSVGSPRPFAGYTNSDFAYIGLGISQDLPYPGKRALRTQVAEAQAGAMLTQSGAVSRMVIEQVKIAYFKLAYLQATFEILLR